MKGIYLIKPNGKRIFLTNKKTTALELHRLIQSKLDNSDGNLSIRDKNVSIRRNDHHIFLINDYYLTEESFKWIYDGSVTQNNTLYQELEKLKLKIWK